MNPWPGKAQPPPGEIKAHRYGADRLCPAALRLQGLGRRSLPVDPWPGKGAAATRRNNGATVNVPVRTMFGCATSDYVKAGQSALRLIFSALSFPWCRSALGERPVDFRRRPAVPRAPASKIAAARNLRRVSAQAAGRAKWRPCKRRPSARIRARLPRPSRNVSAICHPAASTSSFSRAQW